MKVSCSEFDKIDFFNSNCKLPNHIGSDLTIVVNDILIGNDKRNAIVKFIDLNCMEMDIGRDNTTNGKWLQVGDEHQIFYFGSTIDVGDGDNKSIEMTIQASECEIIIIK